ncbi:hypothetical protein NC653_038859 [Populus alba x Populus x berolinensis]|uniref:Uncharacterized protein n=1 Tax=Populus alba x Populus x berolinensis TaxID=444605 RepID=A0AAD6LHS6_9ROSI|nr:hypothetical protein NC653_038859 [Populus alba x Populus x berolinensis]
MQRETRGIIAVRGPKYCPPPPLDLGMAIRLQGPSCFLILHTDYPGEHELENAFQLDSLDKLNKLLDACKTDFEFKPDQWCLIWPSESCLLFSWYHEHLNALKSLEVSQKVWELIGALGGWFIVWEFQCWSLYVKDFHACKLAKGNIKQINLLLSPRYFDAMNEENEDAVKLI